MVNLIMKNKKFRKIIKIKLLIAKLMLASGMVHAVKHDPHIHADRYRKVKYTNHHTLVK